MDHPAPQPPTTFLGATFRPVRESDLADISDLHRAAFGPGRFARTAYRVREGTAPISAHCRAAFVGEELVAALRMTEVSIGGREGALLLGPVAVLPPLKGQGYGRSLIAHALDAARASGFSLVALVGDMSYYARFGFKPAKMGSILLPGPVDYARLLVLELRPDAIAQFTGLVSAVRHRA